MGSERAPRRQALTAAVITLLGAVACRPTPPSPPSVAFLHVTVIDASGAEPKADQTVVVTGDRIAVVAGDAAVPKGATIVDGTGKFLIPGLWDMHFHATNDTADQRRFMALNVANGITGVREMFGSPAVTALRGRIERGEVVGTRMVLGSAIFDGPRPYWPGSVVVANEAEAAAAVKQAKADGAQFIKSYMLLPAPAFFAILRAAKAEGLEVVGHVPYPVTAEAASDSGFRSMEHAYDVWFSLASNSADLQRKAAALLTADRREGFGIYNRLVADAIRHYDSVKAAAVFARFKRNGTWQVPTMAVMTGMARIEKGDFANDPEFKFLPPAMQRLWPGLRAMFPTWTAEDFGALQAAGPGYLRLVGDLYHAGVPLLAGTDTPNPGMYPGFGLHTELELMVRAGLPPLAALQTATRNAAEFLRASDSLGTVAAGKVADLVLLDGNPLADIRNTRRIAGVMLRGVYRDRAALDALMPAPSVPPAAK